MVSLALPALAARYALMRGTERLGLGDTSHVPLGLDGVDEDFISRQMGPLRSLTVTGGSTGTTERRGFAFEWENASNLPAHAFAKMSSSVGTRLTGGISGAMENEVWFYTKLRPRLSIEAPEGYYAAVDKPSGRSLTLIEDVAATKGAQFLNALTPVTKDMAESMVMLLAQLHGQGKALVQTPSTPQTYIRFVRISNERAWLKSTHLRGYNKATDLLPPQLHGQGKALWQAFLHSITLHEPLPQTIHHGDVHIGNWYQCADGRMGLLDWQCVARAHWCRDLAYAISAALSIQDRRAWEEDLIHLYLDTLAQAGGDALSFDETLKLYRSQLPAALVYWTPTYVPPPFFPEMQPQEISAEVIARIGAALVDHEVLDMRWD